MNQHCDRTVTVEGKRYCNDICEIGHGAALEGRKYGTPIRLASFMDECKFDQEEMKRRIESMTAREQLDLMLPKWAQELESYGDPHDRP